MNIKKIRLFLWILLAVNLYVLIYEFLTVLSGLIRHSNLESSDATSKDFFSVLSIDSLLIFFSHFLPTISAGNQITRTIASYPVVWRFCFLLLLLLLAFVKLGRVQNKTNELNAMCLVFLFPVAILFIGSRNLKREYFLICQPMLVFILPFLTFYIGKFRSGNFIPRDDFGIKNPGKIIKNENSFNWQIETGYINVVNPFQGILIVGGAGSGKTYSIIEEIIKQSVQKGYTGFVYDFKYPELAGTLRNAIREKCSDQQRIFELDFSNPINSNRINPLAPSNLPVPAYAGEYAAIILKNLKREWVLKPDFWSDNAIAYLKSIIWYLRKRHPQFCTLPHAVCIALIDYTCVLEMLSAEKDCRLIISSLLTAQRENASAQVAGCISSLQTPIEKLNDASVFWVLSGNDCDLELNSAAAPTFLVAGGDPMMTETLGPAISLIASVVMKKLNQKNRLKSIFLLDEAPTLYIPGLKDLPNTARSNLVSTVYCCQDYSQMDLIYGHDESRALRASLGNQFIGMVNDGSTAEQVSRLFGKGDKFYENKNSSRSSPPGIFSDASYTKGSSWQLIEKDLIRPEEILSLPCGNFIGKTTSSYKPFFSGKIQVTSQNNGIQKNNIDKVYNKDDHSANLVFSIQNTRLNSVDLITMNYEKIQSEAAEIVDWAGK